jgi:peptide-methionine (S)-S-oxide reductase
MNTLSILALLLSVSLTACAKETPQPPPPTTNTTSMSSTNRDTATLAGGCFWCIEAVFQRLEGVDTVLSGYSGGSSNDADYQTVSSGRTKHAEACQIVYNPSVLPYEELLHVFFSAHDPTTLNRQGNDVGPQYRSAIFYHNDQQKQVAEDYIKQLGEAKTWPDPIVTELAAYDGFYVAENYHQNYYNQNGSQPYCAFVVRPKVEKFMAKFKDRVQEEYR